MLIGFDASRSFTKNRTGTENYSFQILSNLSKIDHTNNYNIYFRPPVNLDQVKSSFNWPPTFHFSLITYHFLWTQFGLALQTFKDPLDVLFIPAHTLPLVRSPGLKTVVTVHDLGAEYLPQTHQLKQRLYLNLMTHHQLKSASHIIAVSKSTKKDLIKTVGLPEEKISVVYEGYNQELFKPMTGQKLIRELKSYNLEPQTYFLFVGTIQPRKNLEKLIKAYANFLMGDAEEDSRRLARSEARTDGGILERQDPLKMRQDPERFPELVLVGSKGWLADEIYDLPKKLGIEDKVKFLGFVPDQKLPALYSGARALLFPSLYEGFGLPVLEAMACSCPVLASNTSSLPEVAGQAAVLVDPYSVDSITLGILKVSNRKYSTQLISKGFRQIKNFSWEKAAWETLRILENTTTP